jgi:hypothetical protein
MWRFHLHLRLYKSMLNCLRRVYINYSQWQNSKLRNSPHLWDQKYNHLTLSKISRKWTLSWAICIHFTALHIITVLSVSEKSARHHQIFFSIINRHKALLVESCHIWCIWMVNLLCNKCDTRRLFSVHLKPGVLIKRSISLPFHFLGLTK